MIMSVILYIASLPGWVLGVSFGFLVLFYSGVVFFAIKDSIKRQKMRESDPEYPEFLRLTKKFQQM